MHHPKGQPQGDTSSAVLCNSLETYRGLHMRQLSRLLQCPWLPQFQHAPSPSVPQQPVRCTNPKTQQYHLPDCLNVHHAGGRIRPFLEPAIPNAHCFSWLLIVTEPEKPSIWLRHPTGGNRRPDSDGAGHGARQHPDQRPPAGMRTHQLPGGSGLPLCHVLRGQLCLGQQVRQLCCMLPSLSGQRCLHVVA